MDGERLKNDGSVLTRQYFEEQLQRIREIRLSERKFYQKKTISIQHLLTTMSRHKRQNAFLPQCWAINAQQTAAEVVFHRADAEKENTQIWG